MPLINDADNVMAGDEPVSYVLSDGQIVWARDLLEEVSSVSPFDWFHADPDRVPDVMPPAVGGSQVTVVFDRATDTLTATWTAFTTSQLGAVLMITWPSDSMPHPAPYKGSDVSVIVTSRTRFAIDYDDMSDRVAWLYWAADDTTDTWELWGTWRLRDNDVQLRLSDPSVPAPTTGKWWLVVMWIASSLPVVANTLRLTSPRTTLFAPTQADLTGAHDG